MCVICIADTILSYMCDSGIPQAKSINMVVYTYIDIYIDIRI